MSSFAQAQEFAAVDADSSGELSIEEVTAAWPTLMVTDENNDGQANRSEIVAKIPGLVFSIDSEETQYVVDAFDYADIVKAMESHTSAE